MSHTVRKLRPWNSLALLVLAVATSFCTVAPARAQTPPPLPTVQFNGPTFIVGESDGVATIGVTLSAASSNTVTVDYATSDGTATAPADYQTATGTLTFAPGETIQSFQVTIVSDGLPGPSKTVNLTLTNPQNATLGSPSTAVLTIMDDDPPPPGSVEFAGGNGSPVAFYETNKANGSVTVTVLNASSSQQVTVNYATSDGTAVAPDDYEPAAGALVFGPGQTSQTFDVTLNTASPTQTDVSFNLALSNPVNAVLGPTPNAVVEIREALPTASIVPDAGQAGVTGDVVPSILGGGGAKHYVSPKLTGGFVVLKASVGAGVNFARVFDWDGGQAVAGSPDKRKIPRDTTGKTTVKIKRKAGGAVVDTMHVWVVWTTAAATAIPIAVNVTAAACSVKGGYNFTHTIAPAAIIGAAGDDVPDLTGANDGTRPVPNVAGTDGNVYQKGVNLSGGVNAKWDSSRQARQKVINPANIPFATNGNHNALFYTNYPDWPTGNLVGNDDATANDENNNPYAGASKGTLLGTDNPTTAPLHVEGANGNTFEIRFHCKEFTRLQINGTWFRISDDFLWRIHFKFSKAGGRWADNGSAIALDNAGW